MNINNKQLLLIVVIVIVIVGAAVGAYYYGHNVGYGEGVEIGRASAQVEAGDIVASPMENMPSTNPFDKMVNPFDEAYQNPFE